MKTLHSDSFYYILCVHKVILFCSLDSLKKVVAEVPMKTLHCRLILNRVYCVVKCHVLFYESTQEISPQFINEMLGVSVFIWADALPDRETILKHYFSSVIKINSCNQWCPC